MESQRFKSFSTIILLSLNTSCENSRQGFQLDRVPKKGCTNGKADFTASKNKNSKATAGKNFASQSGFMAGDVREVVLPPIAGGITPPVRQPSNSDDSSEQPEEQGEPPAIPDGSSASPPEAGSPNVPKTPTPSTGTDTAASEIFVNSARATVALQISLEFENGSEESSICTGVVIANNAILTAAHCFVPPQTARIKSYSGYVYSGTNLNQARGRELVIIDKVAVHPDWNGLFHDIAVVTTQQALPNTSVVASFVESLTEVSSNRAVYLMGFGVTGDTRSDSGKMRWTESSYYGEVPADSVPGTTIANQLRLRDASGKTSQACTGDSGGPAFIKTNGMVLGIVSGMNIFVQAKLTCDQGDVNYTYVSPYFPWIKSVAGVALQENKKARPVTATPLTSIESKLAKEPTAVFSMMKTLPVNKGTSQQNSDANASGECPN